MQREPGEQWELQIHLLNKHFPATCSLSDSALGTRDFVAKSGTIFALYNPVRFVPN